MCDGKDGVPQVCGLAAADLENLVEALAKLPPERRAQEALNVSARLVEFAAYESATMLPSDWVGELINWAAQLDRRSVGMMSISPSAPATATLH